MTTSDAVLTPPRARRPLLRALESHQFRLLFSGASLWHICRWMEGLVLSWLALDLTGSAWTVALVGFFRTLPNLVMGLLAGAVADRVNRRWIIAGAQVLNFVTSATVLALLLTHSIQAWHLYVAAFALGSAWSIDFPSRRALMADILGPQLIAAGVSLEAAAQTLGKVFGPFLGGTLIDVSGGGRAAYALLTMTYVFIFQFMVRTRSTTPPPRNGVSLGRSLREGFAYVRTRPLTLGILGGTIVANFAAFPYSQFVTVMAKNVLHINATLMGLLLSAEGVGALGMALFIASRRNLRGHGMLFAIGVSTELVCLIIFSVSRIYLLSLATLLVLGLGYGLFITLQATSILLDSEPAMRGRAMGILALCIGGLPLGNLVYGFLSAKWDAPTAIGTMGVVGLLMMAVNIVVTRLPWRYPTPIPTQVPAPPPVPASKT